MKVSFIARPPLQSILSFRPNQNHFYKLFCIYQRDELTKNKNQIALIEEAKNNPDMYVAIVGDGELHDYLQSKINEYGLKERVKLLGFIMQNNALPGFDEFALPSIKEGLPYVLIDAKMAGLPIVANRVGGVGEILDAKDMSDFSLEQMVQKTVGLYYV